MSTTEPKVINTGAYGMVLSPALQNEPPYENDPQGLITKVFYRKQDYDIILQKQEKLANILGKMNDGYRFEIYEREWQGRNFPPRAQRLLKEAINENGDVPYNSSTRFYPIRMPHLGTSLQSIRGEELASCQVSDLLTAIKKIYQVLGKLAEHRTLHGDIHSGNILVYQAGSFCDMFLIDYDLFETYDEHKKAYAEGRNYLYGPPESYYLLEPHLRPPVSVSNHQDENKEEINMLDAYVTKIYNNDYVRAHYPEIETFKTQIKRAILAHGGKSVHYSQMDSFLASAIFLHLLYLTYPFLKQRNNQPSGSLSPQEEKAIRDTVEILAQGFSFSSAGRLGPDEIVTRLQRVLSRLHGQKTPPPSASNSCSTNKSKKKKNCIVSGGTRKKAKQTKRAKSVKKTRRTK